MSMTGSPFVCDHGTMPWFRCHACEAVTGKPSGPPEMPYDSDENRQPMNSSPGEVDDSSHGCGLAQTTTPSGADPGSSGARNADQTTTDP